MEPLLAAEALTAAPSPLTPRESEVLRAAGTNGVAKEAARVPFLPRGTVRNYLAMVVNTLGADGRPDAHCIAQENGWIQSASLIRIIRSMAPVRPVVGSGVLHNA